MWIKICGLSDPATAREVAALGADAIGLNFCEQSVRFVAAGAAREIARTVPSNVELVGVFVDPTAEAVSDAVGAYGLRAVQLHFTRPDAVWNMAGPADFGSVRWIRAFQVGPRGLAPLAAYFEQTRGQARSVDACLVDAQVDGMLGGTGTTAPWDVVAEGYRRELWPPLVLAGGLRPGNVAAAIAQVHPWGVDVASGVESSPGKKDLALVARFIEEARRAFSLT